MPQKSGLRVVARKGSTSLYIRGTVRGIRICESAGTSDRALAEEAAAIREAEIYRRALHGGREKVAFAAAAELYLRQSDPSVHTRLMVDRIIAHLGPAITCDAIDQVSIDRAGLALCRPGAKPQTIQRSIITPIKAVLTFAAYRQWCDKPMFAPTKSSGRRTDWFTPGEAEALIQHAADHLKPLLTFLFCTGARVGEALALDWKDVNLTHGRIVLRDTKNGDDRLIDNIPARLLTVLTILPRRSGRVFLHPVRRGASLMVPYRLTDESDWGAGGGQIRAVWLSAMRDAGIERHMTPHHARHSWASWHYCLHKDLLRLKADGGWRSLAMVERYAKLAPDGMRSEVAQFWTGTPADVRYG